MPEKDKIVLPTKPIPVTSTEPKSMIIYGSPKIGKTSILSGLKGNFIFDIESGSEFVEALKMVIDHPSIFNQVVKQVTEEQLYSFTTLDTVTKLEEWCDKLSTIKYKRSPQGIRFDGDSITELPHGAGYGLLRTETKEYLNRFKKTAKSTIIVAHVVDKNIAKDRSEVIVKDINLTGKLKSIVAADVDAVGYIYIDPENNRKRRITFLTSDEITCGNRCPHLEGKDFVISEKLEDGSIQTYWEEIYPSLLKN